MHHLRERHTDAISPMRCSMDILQQQ
jgi:hypothetical protein